MHRLVDDPDELDPWISDYEAGRPPRGPQRGSALIQMGISMWATRELAVAANALIRVPFDAVAEVAMDGKRGIWLAQTFGAGHFTVWVGPTI